LAELEQPGRVHPRTDKVVYIGHSYGGVIAANFGVKWQKYALPRPAAMLLCEPGSGPFTGARLPGYKDLQSDCKLLVVIGEHDDVVGDGFGRLVFETAVNTPARNFLVQRSDTSAQRDIRASHAEPYCLDMAFDNGARNYTAKSVLRRSRLDAVDYFCYWKLADALIAFTRNNIYGEVAFGNTPEQRFMGCSADGCAIRELDVELPVSSGQTGLTAAAVKRSVLKARR
jgi:pimeloyl-ACP methyl ester carboxylesterase